jgi:hypothetical protein
MKLGLISGFLFASMDPEDTGDLPKNKRPRCKKRGDGLKELNYEGKSGAKQLCKSSRVNHETGESCSSSSDNDNENELIFDCDNEVKLATENGPLERSTSSDNSEGSDNDTGEMEYLSKPMKPTRSGRIPQRRKPDAVEDDVILGNKGKRKIKGASDSLVSATVSKPGAENQSLPLEDLRDVEPGSLVVLATQSPTNPSHHVYKVFMVAPNPEDMPSVAPTVSPVAVSLPPELMQSVTVNVTSRQLNNESHPTYN